MKILGIETSCDETAVAVVENGRKILASCVASQVETHKIYGGVVPEIASRQHVECIAGLTKEALRQAGLGFSDLCAIAVTHGPGLVGALLVGVNFAKGLSLATGLPLVPVHHLRGHIASLYLSNAALEPPFLCLVASGGHSHIAEVLSPTMMRVIGKTCDDAPGETFDKVARALGLSYPGGIQIDKLAESGDAKVFFFPRPTAPSGKFDYSFSGLKTAAISQLHNARQRGEQISVEDFSASFRSAVVEYLLGNFLSAARKFGYKKLAISGGVSANRLLRRRLKQEAARESLQIFLPKPALCGDNAAMIASQGFYEFLAGNVADSRLNAHATLPIE